MASTLLQLVGRFAKANADKDGIAQTGVPGLITVRATAPSALMHTIFRPLVCLVLQGSKQVAVGKTSFAFSAGDSLVVSADVPTVSQITQASVAAPYLSLVMELDMAVIADVAGQMKLAPAIKYGPASLPTQLSPHLPVDAAPTDIQVTDTALRLMQLLDRPSSLPILHAQIVRELHYWLLAGRHGSAIRALGWPDGPAQRVANAVALLRNDFAETLPVERLAMAANMSPSSFHQHFRNITSLSPRQFQKQLRLIEARRLMIADGVTASKAAFAVGYESVSQFTREYGRMFGLPPVRETHAARQIG